MGRSGSAHPSRGFITRRNPDRVRAPDVAFVAAARLAGRDLEHCFFDGAPDLAVEVLAPGDRAPEVQAKIGEYLGAGRGSYGSPTRAPLP